MKKLLTLVAMAVVGFGTAFGQPPPPPGGGAVDYQLTFSSGTYDSEISYELVPTAGGAAIRSVACGSFDASLVDTVSLTEGISYDFNAYDDWGDGWNGGSYTITRIPCGNIVNSEAPTNGVSGDGTDICDASDLESTFTFVAAACPSCPNPTALMADSISTTTANISWSGTADFYGLEYGPAGFTPNGGGTQIAPATSPVMLSGLMPGTEYDVYIQAGCGIPIPSEFSELVMTSFSTNITNETCETAITIPVADDTTIVMNGATLDGPTPSCSFGTMDDDAWLKFVGTGAPVIIYGSVQDPAVTDFAMEIWDGCPSDTTSNVILCDDDGNDAPSGLMPLGELCTIEGQEYFIRIWQYGTGVPGTIAGLTVKEVRPMITGFTNRSHQGTTVNFTGYDNGDAQVIRYHEFGNSPNFSWKNLNSGAQSGYINNLEPNTRYTVRVGTRCFGETMAAYGDTATFWTKPMPCGTPSWTIDSLIGGNMTLYWENTGADSYKIRYREVGGSWTWVNTTNLSLTLTGLEAGVTYEWQVRGICNDGGNKPYGSVDTFSIPLGRLASTDANSITTFNLYPNPSNGLVTVDFSSIASENITFNVMDLSGKIVFSNTVAANEGSNRVNIDLSNLEAGVYLTTLSNANGVSERVRVILK